jgi:acetyltransferase-like isoleucine patch superfamily enzyme
MTATAIGQLPARKHDAQQRNAQGAQLARALLIRAAVPMYLSLIAGAPAVVALGPALLARSTAVRLAAIAIAPLAFIVVYAIIAGLLSRLTIGALVAGRFPRQLGHAVYGPRRLHALCWTSLYYCTPIYHAVLAIPLLKRVVFRLFGYRGALDVVLYPDTWVRDLPVLDIGPGVYLSNRATIGTNMCLMNGEVLVAPVRIGAGAMVGHLAMIAPGAVIGDHAEIGVGAGIGMSVVVGSRSRIGPNVTVHHGARIGAGCDIGATCYIGMRCVIADGLTIPPGTKVPSRVRLTSQSDVDLCTGRDRALSAETSDVA